MWISHFLYTGCGLWLKYLVYSVRLITDYFDLSKGYLHRSFKSHLT